MPASAPIWATPDMRKYGPRGDRAFDRPGAFRHHIETNAHFGSNIDKLFVVESIPRNELGKIQPALLKEMLQSIAEESCSPA